MSHPLLSCRTDPLPQSAQPSRTDTGHPIVDQTEEGTKPPPAGTDALQRAEAGYACRREPDAIDLRPQADTA